MSAPTPSLRRELRAIGVIFLLALLSSLGLARACASDRARTMDARIDPLPASKARG